MACIGRAGRGERERGRKKRHGAVGRGGKQMSVAVVVARSAVETNDERDEARVD